jgi:hypothetical protein
MGIGNNLRRVADANLTSVTALTASASQTKQGTSIDLGSVSPEALQGIAILRLDVPSIAALTGAHTIAFSIQDSADNSSFADVAAISTITALGSAPAAIAQDWSFPDNIRRYVRLKLVSSASAEDCSAQSATLQVYV